MIINTSTEIYGKSVQNRVVFQPMEGCDGERDGSPAELTYRRYNRFGKSGAGIIWLEAIAVSGECRANPRQLYMTEKNKDSFARLIEDIKKTAFDRFGFEPVVVAQLTNSGRYSKPNGTPEPIIAYHNPLWEKGKENQPYLLATDDYCDGIVEKYAVSAKLASEAGADGVDVKCCHGYLMDEFLSAFERPGKYGGSFENRTAFYLNCIKSAKSALNGNTFVTSRLNATDAFPYPYGYGVNEKSEIDLSETKKLLSLLAGEGMEMVNITLGNPYLIPDVNRPWRNGSEAPEIGLKRIYTVTSELQREFKDIKMVMSGLSYPAEGCVDYAEKALSDGVAHFAGFGRMTFSYPDFYKDYLENGTLDKKKCCIACGKCTELMRHGGVAGCPIRDSETYMPLYKKYVTGE